MDYRANNFETMNDTTAELMNGKSAKITIIKFADFGDVVCWHMTAEKMTFEPYAQYRNAIKIDGKFKNKRKASRIVLHEQGTFALFAGWVSPTLEQPTCWTCFDRSLFYKTVDSMNGEKLGEESERVYPNDLNAEDIIYRVYYPITNDEPDTFITKEKICLAYDKVGEIKDNIRRRELQGAPVFSDIGAPMYGGVENGRIIIRYESHKPKTPVTRSWKVYGLLGHRQAESFNESSRCDWTDGANVRIVETLNSDKTGTNEYSIVRITRNSAAKCLRELEGQMSDGIFENCRTGDAVEIFDEVNA